MNAPVITSAENPSATAADGVHTQCPNCLEPLLGAFCYACGQPRKGFIRHLAGILEDFLDTVFNIDSRTIRTIFPLYFKPGFLSLEYFAGRQVRYVTPLRMYFFFSVLAFLAVSWVTHIEGEAPKAPSVATAQSLRQQRDEALEVISKQRSDMGEIAFNAAHAAASNSFDAPIAAAEARELAASARHSLADESSGASAITDDTPRARAPADAADTSTKASASATEPGTNGLKVVIFNSKPWDPTTEPVSIPELSEGNNAWLNKQVERMVRNGKLVQEDPDRFLAQVFSLAPQTLFVMLPLFALMLKCFYLFKRRFYMEHLIVALHSHSFVCLSILLLAGLYALGGYFDPTAWSRRFIDVIEILVISWIPIHLFLAQKRIYKQGWTMTTIKYFVIGAIYSVLISFGILINMMLSLAWL